MKVFYSQAIDGVPKRDVERLFSLLSGELHRRGMRIVSSFSDSEVGGSDTVWSGTDEQLVARTIELIKGSDAVLVDLTMPGRVYIGCICELVYAKMSGKPACVIVGESDLECRPWLTAHATSVCRTIDDALRELERIKGAHSADRP